MRPVQPIIPGHNIPVTVIAEDQKNYKALPAYVYPDGCVLSRWRLSWKERITALINGDVYLYINTFGSPLQPVYMQVDKPATE